MFDEKEIVEVVKPVEEKKEGKLKIDRKGSKKWKTIFITGALLVVTAVGGVLYYNYKVVPTIDESLSTVLEYKKDSTCFDEVLLENEAIANDVANLESYLTISDELHTLELEKYTKDLKPVEIPKEQYSIELIEELIKEFDILVKKDINVLSKDSLRFYEVARLLSEYQTLTDQIIEKNGYEVISKYTDLLARATILDASGLNQDGMTNLTVTNTVDAGKKANYVDSDTNKNFEMGIASNSALYDLLNIVAVMNAETTEEPTLDEKVENISKAMNLIKVMQFLSYDNNSNIVQVGNYSDVRQAYDEMAKQKVYGDK